MADPVTLTHFTPAEAEAITGVSTVQQRDWRRRGHLRPHDGQARFDAFALADLLVMRLLSSRGGLQRSALSTAGIGIRIAGYALRWRDAWEGDHDAAPGTVWGDKARWLLRELTNMEPDRFCVWFSDDTFGFTDSVDDTFNRFSSDDLLAFGPMVVLDLDALGKLILTRAGRALAHATLADADA